MEFVEILNRLRGIRSPVLGISWNPVEIDRNIARKIVIFLELRRVLYSAYEYASVCPCIKSVTKIKYYLTDILQQIDEKSKLNSYIRAMRNACNKFLTKCPDSKNFRCFSSAEPETTKV